MPDLTYNLYDPPMYKQCNMNIKLILQHNDGQKDITTI